MKPNKNISLPLTVFFLLFRVCVISSQNIETVVQTGHYASVDAVCYSFDGKLIATAGEDKIIKLWRSSDGKEIRSFVGNKDPIIQISFNRQGALLLSVSQDGKLIIWDVNTGKITSQFNLADDKFTCASFNPAGTEIVAGSKKSHVSLWHIASGEQKMIFKANPVNLSSHEAFDYAGSKTVAFSNDGQFVVAGAGDKTAIIWDVKTGNEVRKYKKTRNTCSNCMAEAQITSDNKYVLSVYSDSVKMFDRVTGELVKEFFNQKGSLQSLCISNDNRFVAAIEYGLASVWELRSGKLLFEAGEKSRKKATSVAFSPDANHLILGSELRVADVWDIKGEKKVLTLKGHLNQVDERLLSTSIMYWAALVNESRLSPDGRYIGVGRTGNNAKLVDFKTGKIYKTLRGHTSMVLSLSFSNNGKYLATGGLDGKAILWDVETGKALKTFEYRDSTMAIFSVDISPDNKMLATADWGGTVVLWDIETGRFIRAASPHGGMASYHVKFSPNGAYIVSAGLDRNMVLIETDTKTEVRKFIGHTSLVNSIGFSPAGDKMITSSTDGTVRVWDFLSSLQLMKVHAHEGGTYSAHFDSSGKIFVSGGDDNMVKLWDAATGKVKAEFSGHQGAVGDVNITPDQRYLISGSRDGSIRIWNIEKKTELVSMIFVNENDWFVKNKEGYFDASDGALSSVSFVKGTEVFEVGQFFNEFFRPGLYRESFGITTPGFRQNINGAIEKSPPPTVEIISPENATSTLTASVIVMAKITHMGGGVKELKVMHNGKRQVVDDSDLKRMTKAGQYVMKTFDIHLVPGENEIAVSAFSEGAIESQQAIVRVMYKGMQKTSNVYVLCIGINKYENESMNLTYARSDAQGFSELMKSKSQKLFKNVYCYTLFDKEATRAKILSTLDEISKQIKKEDVFVFFYAGHGSTINNLFYFVPTECTALYQEEKLKSAIQANELQEKFKLIQALKQVVFVDACHSGSSVDMLAMRGGGEEKALAQLSRSSGVHVMASSESTQLSAEVKSLGHGIFTYVLLEALNGKADGAPKDTKVTVYELKSFIDDQVPEISYDLIRHKQFPSTFSVGQDFPLVME